MIDIWTFFICCSVCISAVLTGLVIPQVLKVAFKKKLFDNPDFRKIHKGVVPRLGGFSYFPSLLCSFLLIAGCLIIYYPDLFAQRSFTADLGQILVMFASVSILYLIGLKDDMVEVKYYGKFTAQGLAAFLTVLSGACIFNLWGLFGVNVLSPIVAALLTFILILGIINAMNLIDGIDGLASGIGIISLLMYGILFLSSGNFLMSLLAWSLAASVGVFFFFNFFGNDKNKKKIFMGDVGSLTMGMVIAFLAVEMTSVNPVDILGFNPLVVALSPLIIPILDSCRVFIYRISQKRSPFLPDKSHIHHKLISFGLSPHQTLFFILSFQIVLIIVNVWLSAILNINIILGIDIAAYLCVVFLCPFCFKFPQKRIAK